MADAFNVAVQQNGYRNIQLLCTLQSDGSGVTSQKIFDATSGGSFGVSYVGQTFYPGTHVSIIGLDYDVQDMKLILQWDATPSALPLLNLGNAPEDFDWTRIGGLRVPAAGSPTGSILATTTEQTVGATCTFLLYLRKNVP